MKYLLLVLLSSACAPLTCQTLSIDIYGVENKPKKAGRVVLRCDGKQLVEAVGENVTSGGQ